MNLFGREDVTTWVRHAFVLPPQALDAVAQRRRIYSDTSLKFTDTSLGGNFCINPPAQFTPTADPRMKSFWTTTTADGMGRYYSEAIDDNNVLAHFRFGVAEFNSMRNFFTNFYDYDVGYMARTGRTTNLGFVLGKLIGTVVGWPLVGMSIIGRAYRFAFGKPASKYYYLKPTMPVYWNAVNDIANNMAVNLGIVAPLWPSAYDVSKNAVFNQSVSTEQQKQALNSIIPDVWRENGTIDVYGVATRAQRLSASLNERILEALGGSLEEANQRQLTMREAIEKIRDIKQESLQERKVSLRDYLSKYLRLQGAQPTHSLVEQDAEGVDKDTGKIVYRSDTISDAEAYPSFYPNNDESNNDTSNTTNSAAAFLMGEVRDGAQFITYRIDNPGNTGESFNNSTRESDIASTLNGFSGGMKNTRFSLMDGQIAGLRDIPVVGDMIVGAMEQVKGVITGAIAGAKLDGLLGLAGSAFVDIPKHWESSTANMPRAEFTIPLRSPYGNDASRYQAILLPIATLLAAALPMATGGASYTSPFLCECYVQGRCQIRLGMIESLTFTRGTGNQGWTPDGKFLGVDVTVSVVDMSSILTVPVGSAMSPTDLLDPDALVAKILGEDSPWHDYLAVLTSMSLSSQIYQFPKLMRNITRFGANWDAFWSVSHGANWLRGTWPVSTLSNFFKTAERM
jgi:hypothetical protein